MRIRCCTHCKRTRASASCCGEWICRRAELAADTSRYARAADPVAQVCFAAMNRSSAARLAPPDLAAALKQRFGFDSFRPGQEEVVRDILAGHDVLAIMPTGGGKSLCFQLPALLHPGVCIVISPLIALMQDQVRLLQNNGIDATFINSSLERSEVSQRLARL